MRNRTIVKALNLAVSALCSKQRQLMPYLRRVVTHCLFIKSAQSTENDLRRTMAPVFEKQIREIANRMSEMGWKFTSPEGTKSNESTAHALVMLAFDPQEYRDDIIDAALPVVAIAMAKAMRDHMKEFGVDVRRMN